MTSGQMRADRIIEREMRRARSFEEWSRAHLELEELGKVADLVHGKRLKDAPSLTAELFFSENRP